MMSYIPSFSCVQVNDCLKYVVKNTLDLERSALTYLILVMLESTGFTLSGYQMTQGPFNCRRQCQDLIMVLAISPSFGSPFIMLHTSYSCRKDRN
ncbi:hypothetical protein BJ165DRAFT_1478456 [Panaeolus papilionaceus]|nr:hypothetical protein BJ165DRAFT_1478456 [Panaeolus papilionaceus]